MNLAYQQRSRPQLPPEELIRGIEQFNRGAYSDCRTTLEFLSLSEPRLEKNLYLGIIQIAVGMSHWQAGDFRGTLRMLHTGNRLLQRVAPICLRVDVDDLIRQTGQVLGHLEKLGMEEMNRLAPDLAPRIKIR